MVRNKWGMGKAFGASSFKPLAIILICGIMAIAIIMICDSMIDNNIILNFIISAGITKTQFYTAIILIALIIGGATGIATYD